MKQTIEGKTYNTDTAELIAEDSYNGSSSDFQWWSEELYITKKGAFFLYGRGGAMSSYAEACGNNRRSGGSQIIPMTKAGALAWCEEHDEEAAIEEYFSDMVEEA